MIFILQKMQKRKIRVENPLAIILYRGRSQTGSNIKILNLQNLLRISDVFVDKDK